MKATLVSIHIKDGWAYASARVNEGDPQGTVEYIASVPIDEAWEVETLAGRKALLVAALKRVRDQQQGTTVDLGVTETITL